MGLSASAIRLASLPEFITPEGVVALDWYMFARMIHNNAKAIFSNEMTTFYRQYDSNLVGMKQMTLQSLKREINIKYAHYNALKQYSVEYEKLIKSFNHLMKIAENEEDLKLLYGKISHNKITYPYWWENTKNGSL